MNMKDSILIDDARRINDFVNLKNLYDKSILIVGGTGLIGTYFIYSIIEAANRGFVPKKLTITHLHDLPSFIEREIDLPWIELLRGDLCDDNFVNSLPKYDFIIHLAGYGQPAQFSIDPIKTIKLNTSLTISLLEKINKDGKFIYASSSGIYNGLNKDVFTEDDVGTTNTLHPRACYYEGKKCGEVIVNSFRLRGIDAKSARLSYTYGPGVRKTDERAMYSFIKKGLSGEITMLDDGSAQRIYCYVSDAVILLWNILLKGDKEIYNVGGKQITTIREIAKMVADYLGVTVTIPTVNNSVLGNHLVERLDMTRTLTQFPIEFISIEEGLKRTIDWYRSEYYKD